MVTMAAGRSSMSEKQWCAYHDRAQILMAALAEVTADVTADQKA